MKLSDNKATLSFSNGSPNIEMPVYQGTIGPDVIDIRKLYGQTGMFTYDPGFLSTASCQSGITYIDGDKGELLYRGYPIEQLATQCDYLETCYLLLKGELPNATQKQDFTKLVTNHTMVNEQMQFFLRGFRRDAHPMAVVTGSGPHAGDIQAKRFPYDAAKVAILHSDLVIALTCLIIALLLIIRINESGSTQRAFYRSVGLFLFVCLAQGLIGYVQYFTGLPELLVGAHLFGSTLVWISACNIALIGRVYKRRGLVMTQEA